jgi:16S rRNA (cytidine1402-2'-O)-methyltransferase
LSAAGLDTRSFRFAGFLPREAGPLRRFFASLALEADTVVAFESPNRLPRSLKLLAEALPDRRIAVCRELTKVHEEIFVGSAAEAALRFTQPQGEIVVVIEGARAPPSAAPTDDAALREEIEHMKALGLTRAQATPLLERRHGLPRRRLYQIWLEVARTGTD